MRFLIIYGTGEGQTRKIARYMEEVLEDAGYKASVADVTEDPPQPHKYDAILIGSSVHTHRYHDGVKNYISTFKEELNKKPSAFFSVCMAVASKIEEEHEEAHQLAKEFLENTGWTPTETWHIAGALKYTQYDYFKRLVMRMIASKQGGGTDTDQDYEYTDWEAVKNSVLQFAKNE